MEIQAAPVKSVGGDFPLHLPQRGVGGIIHLRAILAFAVPKRGHAKCHRPISRLLENRGVAIVPHLEADVLERLPEGAEFRPSLVTGRARHPVLSSESRKRVHFNSRSGKAEAERLSAKRKTSRRKPNHSEDATPDTLFFTAR